MTNIKPRKNSSKINSNLEDQFQIIEEVGKGAYASVFKARQKNGHQQIRAIKKLIIDPLLDDIGQVQRLKSLRGDHIIEFYGYIIESNEINLIMNLSQGSLRDQMNMKKQFTPEVILSLMVQVTSAMIGLSQKNVMHLDLKPENILYEKGDFYKLCDFGCSQLFQSVSKRTFAIKQKKDPSFMPIPDCTFGTPEFISPEIQLGKNKVGRNSCDVWSFGIIIYRLIYKNHPFRLGKNRRVLNNDFEAFLRKQIFIDFPQVSSRFPIQILKLMLRPIPQDRITWKGIRQKLIIMGKSQFQFMNLELVISKQIKMSLIFGTIIMLLNDNLQTNNHIFWRDNAYCLEELKEVLVYLSLAQIKQMKKMFGYKFMTKLSKKRSVNLNFMMENFQQEQKKLKKIINMHPSQKENIQALQLRFRNIVNILLELTKKAINNQESKYLSYFIEEASQLKTLFCQGDRFQKICHIFDIKQS